MFTRSTRIALICFLMFLPVAACGDDDNDDSANEGGMDASTEDTAVSGGSGGNTGTDGGREDADAESPPSMDAEVEDADSGGAAPPDDEPYCGDEIVQEDLGEQCDDGNYFLGDGCNALCELECEENEDCDDDDPCNGEETCNADNICEDGPDPGDGTPCGPRKHCFSDSCLDDVCGDLLVNEEYLGEECDDGNGIDEDGCTSECRFTCETNSDCEGGDPCAGTRSCDTDTHMCAGEPLDDEAPCSTAGVDDGWCQGGACVPTDCGDNIWIEGTAEECDLGEDNGKPGSGCSRDCRIVVCGDGDIQGDEQCDDGNLVNLDGCDENCKAELFIRWTLFNVLPSDSDHPTPEWCVHADSESGGNQFAKAFAGRLVIPMGAGEIEVDVLEDVINGTFMGEVFEGCQANAIVHLSGLDDLSFTRSDNTVEFAGYSGQLGPSERCSNPMRVDTGFQLRSDGLDENNRPEQIVPVVQRPGVIMTEEPITITAPEGGPEAGVGTLHDLMLKVPVDIENLSTPPDIADSVEIPEEFGYAADRSGTPAGIACAAMETSGIELLPILPQEVDFFSGGPCCKKAADGSWESYDACAVEGDVVVETPGEDCDSMLELLKTGCTLCLNLDAEDPTDREEYFDCNKCLREVEVIQPTPLDVDTTGDGEPDAYSLVVAIQGKRIRSLGVDD